MAKTKINCLNCNIECYAENKEIKRGFGKFCSRKCSNEYHTKNTVPAEPNVKCALCGVNFYLNFSKQAASKSGLYFCCRAHKEVSQCIGGIKEIQPPHYGETLKDYRTIVFKITRKPKKCERCGYDHNEAAIIVHHRDRNRDNNDISNLEVLCCNCHAIEHYSECG